MKKVFISLMMMVLAIEVSMAQTPSKEDVKNAKKKAKEYVKEGWEVVPGKLPLESQLERSYTLAREMDDTGLPKFIVAEAMSIGQNYDAAKMQALDLAKINLAGQIQTEITSLIESSVANEQLAEEEAVSITETVAASKSKIAQNIGRIIPIVECYRTRPNKNKEVLVMVGYNSQLAMEAAKKTVRQELEKKGEKLHEQLDKVMGF